MEKIVVFTDGGARGNPGPAAIGVVIQKDDGKILAKLSKAIGRTTNNVAEYQAVIEALQWIVNNLAMEQFGIGTIVFFLDSKLVVNQLNGFFKIKDSHLRELLLTVRELEAKVRGNIFYQLIPREKNFLADQLVNQCLDNCLM
jgi:ribonuclease HI